MLGTAISVDKDKIGVTVNGDLTFDTNGLMIVPFHDECLFYKTEHRHLPLPSFRLRRIHIEIAAFLVILISVVTVHKCMVDINDFVIQIDVTSSETGYFTDTQAGANHDGENRIPV